MIFLIRMTWMDIRWKRGSNNLKWEEMRKLWELKIFPSFYGFWQELFQLFSQNIFEISRNENFLLERLLFCKMTIVSKKMVFTKQWISFYFPEKKNCRKLFKKPCSQLLNTLWTIVKRSYDRNWIYDSNSRWIHKKTWYGRDLILMKNGSKLRESFRRRFEKWRMRCEYWIHEINKLIVWRVNIWNV